MKKNILVCLVLFAFAFSGIAADKDTVVTISKVPASGSLAKSKIVNPPEGQNSWTKIKELFL